MSKHVAMAGVLKRSFRRRKRSGPEVSYAPVPAPERGIRWRPGERLDVLFEERCDRLRNDGKAGHLAVDAGDVVLTYGQLDARANQLARRLIAGGARPGDRIALLFDDAVFSYVGMLAVLKIRAAYVPLDVAFPAGRISFIIEDAGVHLVLSLRHLEDKVPDGAAEILFLDQSGRVPGRDRG
jgi:non-ribosomal peptide synthetase component F